MSSDGSESKINGRDTILADESTPEQRSTAHLRGTSRDSTEPRHDGVPSVNGGPQHALASESRHRMTNEDDPTNLPFSDHGFPESSRVSNNPIPCERNTASSESHDHAAHASEEPWQPQPQKGTQPSYEVAHLFLATFRLSMVLRIIDRDV